ncbi:MAG: S8 family serine peptidase [Erysipelotrichaceae bacterium]|nr:S8 family serine peptidase [Erysipelotrichaceae bacterium]
MKKLLSLLLASALMFSGMTVAHAEPLDEPVGYPPVEETEEKDNSVDPSKIGIDVLNLPAGEGGQISKDGAEEEQKYSDSDIVRVSIVLDRPSTLDAGYSIENVADNVSAMRYRSQLNAEQQKVVQSIVSKWGIDVDVKWNLTLATNMISAEIRYGDIEKVEEARGVKAVVIENKYEMRRDADDPNTTFTTKEMIYATEAWASGYTGAGSKVAIIDTGINDKHRSFDSGAFEYAIKQTGKDVDLLTKEELSDLVNSLNVSVNPEQAYLTSKIPFAYNYVDDDYETDHYHDTQEEHGSHVSGIAAANRFVPDGSGGYVDAASTIYAVGVAPDAQILTMKVFGKNGGAYDSDYMAAIEDAIVLGADSINLSLGSSASGFTFSYEYQEVMDSLTEKGAVVVMSAGNAYAWNDTSVSNAPMGHLYEGDVSFDTVGEPGSYVNSLAVASATNVGLTGSPLIFNDTISAFYTETQSKAARMKTIAGDYDYVYIDALGEELDYAVVSMYEDLEGKIVIVNRGDISFYLKGNNAIEYNPAAVVIANNADDGAPGMDLTDFAGTFPMVSISKKDAESVKETSEENHILLEEYGIEYYYYTGKVRVTSADEATTERTLALEEATVSDFSSWGVPSSLILKPEITAPGESIYSINGMTEDDYENMDGTSMAAPHITGMAAILAQYIRENDLAKWTDGNARTLITSLLMSTAIPMKPDGEYLPVIQQGAGLGNVNAAANALSFIMMGEDATASYADGKVKAELGANETGKYEFSFSITNMSEDDLAYAFSSDMFTQKIETIGGERYLSKAIDKLDAEVIFDFSEEGVFGHDVDKDGDTDYYDAQALLDYLTEKVDGAELDLEAGEMDDVEGISSYDAKLLIDWLAVRGIAAEGQILVRAGETRDVKVTITLNDTAILDENYINGAYVEGFAYLTCVSTTDDGGLLDVSHSIPILGYYGNWEDPSMFDVPLLDYYYDGKTPYAGVSTNYMELKYPSENKPVIFSGNPYIIEETFPEDRLAISSDTSIMSFKYTLIRNGGNAGVFGFALDDSDDISDTLLSAKVTEEVYSAYTYLGQWRNNKPIKAKINQTVSSLGLAEGDRFSIGAYAIPEYTAMQNNGSTSGSVSSEEFETLAKSGELGKGTYYGYTLTVDDSAPVIDEIETDLDAGTVTVRLHDNEYVALLALTDAGGSYMYDAALPDQSKAGENITYTFDISEYTGDIEDCNSLVIFAADYAANETAVLEVIDEDAPISKHVQIFVLTDEIEDGVNYVIANSEEAGYGYVLASNGLNYLTGSALVAIEEDENIGAFIYGSELMDSDIWTAVAVEDYEQFVSFAFTNYQFGGDLGPYDYEMAYATWDENPVEEHVYFAPSLYYIVNDPNDGPGIYGGMNFNEDDEEFMFSEEPGAVYLYAETYILEETSEDIETVVTISPSSLTLIMGVQEEADLTAYVEPAYLPDRTVSWMSYDTDVVTVNEEGHVKAVAIGSTYVLAISNYNGEYDYINVNVVEASPMEDTVVFGQVASGEKVDFVMIDLSDMSMVSIGDGNTPYIGGAEAGNYIYGNDDDMNFYRYVIGEESIEFDPTYEMFTIVDDYALIDGANMPAHPFYDEESDTELSLTLVGITESNLIEALDPAEGQLLTYDYSSETYGDLVAITYAGTFESGYGQTDAYYAIDNAGVFYYVYLYINGDNEMEAQIYPAMMIDGISFEEDVTAYSMTFGGYLTGVSSVFVADNNTKSIYFIDLSDEEAQSAHAEYIGTIEGIDNISTLFDLNNDSVSETSGRELPARIKDAELGNGHTMTKASLFEKSSEEAIANDAQTIEEEPAEAEPVAEETPTPADETAEIQESLTEEAPVAEETPVAGEPVEETTEPVGEEEPAEVEPVAEEKPAPADVTVEAEEPTSEEAPAEPIEPVEDGDVGNAVTGSLNNVRNYVHKPARTEKAVLDVKAGEIESDDYTITYTEDVDVTNGMITVTYDPELLTYVGAESSLDYYSVNETEKGTIKFAFASEDHELKGNILAKFIFTPGCEDADVDIEVNERDSDLELAEKNAATVKGIGHEYGEPEWTWAEDYSTATAKFVCANNEEHVLVEKAEVSVEKVEATTSKEGKITYTAKVVVNGKEYTDVKTVILPKTPDTGDHSNIDGWYRTFMAGVAGMYVAIVLLRKGRKETA